MKIRRRTYVYAVGLAVVGALLFSGAPSMIAQEPPPGGGNGRAGGPPPPPPPKPGPVKLDLVDGSTAGYRVQEQLAGINFPSEAIGTTTGVTGTIALNADGTVDSSVSKLTIDLRTLKSDQDMRDGYIQKRTLETDKFPTAVFVPKTLTGVATPFPNRGQAGFELTGDLTVHGTTAPVTWQGIATFNTDGASGRGSTSFTFSTFGITKPSLARILNVDDKINLDVMFKFKTTRVGQ